MLRRLSLLVPAAAFALLAACGKEEPAKAPPAAAATLTVLAGSELRDIEPLLPRIRAATGVAVELKYAGTLDAVERLQAGERFDAAWLSNNKYALLTPGVKERILASERTMITPVVLGLKESKAKELGWLDNPNVTWKDIAEKAGQGRFTFAMTSPSASNTGFSGLLGLAAALAGKGDALEVSDIDAKRLGAFFRAQRLTAGSSGWLAEAYVKEQGRIDGMVNYASVMMQLNREGKLGERLALIYPKDGIVSADYPLMLLNPARRDAYDKVVAYVRGPEFQKAIMETTLRRPVNPDVAVDPSLATGATLIELPFPRSREVIDAVLESFENDLRRPADATFLLDVSGSMEGERIAQLKKAMIALTGADTSISGRYARFRNRERIVIIPFNARPQPALRFDLSDSAERNAATLADIRAKIEGLGAHGGTAIFTSTRAAYQEALQRRKTGKDDRYYSIVLMTDGENRDGETLESFRTWYGNLPPADRGIRVFAILFGEAKPPELTALAELTGGRVFDGRKTNLAAVFKDIRSYQ